MAMEELILRNSERFLIRNSHNYFMSSIKVIFYLTSWDFSPIIDKVLQMNLTQR